MARYVEARNSLTELGVELDEYGVGGLDQLEFQRAAHTNVEFARILQPMDITPDRFLVTTASVGGSCGGGMGYASVLRVLRLL